MDHEYDVAISFLSSDIGVARDLRDRLVPQLRVFLYTHRQEDVSGTDGLVTFRATFRDAAHLVVVLFRIGWGETPWTRVESEAITDRFLKEGPNFLFFIMLDSASNPPPWVPDRLIRFALADYGIDQAVDAIKLRVQELGGAIHRETVAERAKRAQELEQFNAETAMLWRDQRGVDGVKEQAMAVASALQRLAEEASNAAPGLGLECRSQDTAVGIRSRKVSVYGELLVRHINSLDEVFFLVRILPGNIILPGENRYYRREPEVLAEHRYTP
ncbi:MAG: hypothetical protein Q8P50_13485, partial [Bacillota bacterium]|nr:hypothetical protein [Bacillota bacterium]